MEKPGPRGTGLLPYRQEDGMAQRTMTIKIEPTPAIEQMLDRVAIRAARHVLAERVEVRPPAEGGAWMPITINALGVIKYMYVDSVGESHFVFSEHQDAARARGWRQAFCKALAG
jgi:hypothetical protein